MKLLMISTDAAFSDTQSPAFARLVHQAALVDRLDVILFARQGIKTSVPIDHGKLHVHPIVSSAPLLTIIDAVRTGAALVVSGDPDTIVDTQDPIWTGVVGYLIAHRRRVPLHIQLHTDIFSRFWRQLNWMRRVEYPLALFLLSHADHVRVVSLRLLHSLRVMGIPDSRITKNPIPTNSLSLQSSQDTERFFLRDAYPEFGQIVLSMGRLTREKDFGTLLRAFARVRAVCPDSGLVLVGHGPEFEDLRFLARSLDIESSVKFLPWARHVGAYYRSADVYVQPSLYEGWGLAVIEALLCGTPVIMTDTGCAGEVVIDGKTGLIVDPKDDEALAQAIVWTLRHPKEAGTLAAAGKDKASTLATPGESLRTYKDSWGAARDYYDHKHDPKR